MRETKVSVYTTNVYLALIVEFAIISSKAGSVDGFQGELNVLAETPSIQHTPYTEILSLLGSP